MIRTRSLLVVAVSAALVLAACGKGPEALQDSEPNDSRDIIGGAKANHPAIVKTGCTSTVISPSVIVSAAHCQTNNTDRSFTHNGKTYRARMFNHPNFSLYNSLASSRWDVAIGVLSEPVPGIKPIRVSADRTAGWHTFWGYGCTSADGRTGYGTLRRGSTYWYSSYYNRLVQHFRYGQAACPGDSGGPVFGADGQLESVMSRTDYRGNNYAAAVAHPEVLSFIRARASTYKVSVCGVTSGGCAAAKLCKYKMVKSGSQYVFQETNAPCDSKKNFTGKPACKYTYDETRKRYSPANAPCFALDDPNDL